MGKIVSPGHKSFYGKLQWPVAREFWHAGLNNTLVKFKNSTVQTADFQKELIYVDKLSRRAVMFDNIDWNGIAEAMKTENIMKYASSTDPLSIIKNPYFWVPGLIFCLLLFLLKFRRTLSFFIGAVVLWNACYYLLPKNGKLELHDIGVFGSVFIGVLGFWIYMFLLRSE